MSDSALGDAVKGARRALRVVPGEYRAMSLLLAGWLAWTVINGVWAGSGPFDLVPYGSFALALAAGMVMGRWGALRSGGVVVPATAAVLALGVTVVPLYPNAQAAVGVQLTALASLMILRTLAKGSGAVGAASGARSALIALVAVLGVLLASLSQASIVLVVLVAVLSGLGIARSAPGHRVILGAGVGLTALAMIVVLLLANLATWPTWLSDRESFSVARHYLWEDALHLWAQHPYTGGGPGSFYWSSEFAQSDPLYYAAHSSILQVGSEQGIIGVLLFASILGCGAMCAARQGTARTLIGVSAWCALAIHSTIDHLYEFPVVVLVAGAVIGWAGTGAPWKVRRVEV